MNPIEKGWQSYRRLVLPADASEIQVTECRRAFFAGAAVLMRAVTTSLDPGSETTARDLRVMQTIQGELDEFSRALDLHVLGPGAVPGTGRRQ